MESKDIINTEKEIEKLKLIKSKNKFVNLKSDYFIQKLFDYMEKRISLKIIKCNINIQKRLNININNYKDFSEKFSSIELDIIPIQNEYGPFIKIKKKIKNIFIYILIIIKKKLKKQNYIKKIKYQKLI